VVNDTFSYNLLLVRPYLNRLRAIVSFVHLKIKFRTIEGKVATMRFNQKVTSVLKTIFIPNGALMLYVLPVRHILWRPILKSSTRIRDWN